MNFGYVTVNGVNSNNKYISKLSGKLKKAKRLSDYELAAKGVALTTILSVVTMPIVSEIVFHIAV